MRFTLTIILLFLTFAKSPVLASGFSFERGGISDSLGIVDKNSLQIELGAVSYERSFQASKDFNYDLLPTLLRFGLVEDRFELRLFSSGMSLDSSDFRLRTLAPGFKLKLLEERKYLPGLELISSFSIPLSTRNSEANYFHFYKLLINKALTKRLNFLINTSLSFNSFDLSSGREFISTSIPYVFNLNYALSDKLTLLGEVFGSWSLSDSSGTSLGLAYGLTYLARENLAFDITNYFGLNDASTDFGISTGLSYRF